MFNNPWAFLLVLPWAAAVAWRIWGGRGFRLPFNWSSSAPPPATWRTRLWFLPETLRFLTGICVIIALAGPVRLEVSAPDSSNGLRLGVLLDRSGSMAAEIQLGGSWVPRLEAVKQATADFLDHRPQDQIALISFARYPETHTPLTLNHAVTKDLLASVQVAANQDEDGTAIGDALALGTARLSGSGRSQAELGPGRALILLTDGQNNRGEINPRTAAENAAKAGLKVYTIGLGGQGTVVQDTPFNGKQRFPANADLDEDSLREISDLTGGAFFKVEKMSDLAAVYSTIGQLETQRLSGDAPVKHQSAFEFWLILALLGLAAEVCFHTLLLRRLP